MNIEVLTSLKGKHISIIVNGLPHPSSGFLKEVGVDYIVLEQESKNKIIVATNQITSILVGAKQGVKDDYRASRQ